MTHKETVERNIGLTFDYVNFLIDNKEEIEKLPETFTVEFLEKDFPQIEHKQETLSTSHSQSKKYVRVRNSFDITL
jgi:hypothetical protein